MSTLISQTEDLSSLQAHYRRYGSSSSLAEDYSSLQDDSDVIRWTSAFEQYFSWLDNAQQQLKEIRQEATEASVLDNEIDPVPDSAYDDAHSLLKMFSHYKIPMPEIGWAEDGSLGFEWRPENGIATMGVYGDNHVIYGAFFDAKRQTEGICSLSDNALLRGFLMTLLNLPF